MAVYMEERSILTVLYCSLCLDNFQKDERKGRLILKYAFPTFFKEGEQEFQAAFPNMTSAWNFWRTTAMELMLSF